MTRPNYGTMQQEELFNLDEQIRKRRKTVTMCRYRLREAEESLVALVRIRDEIYESGNPKKLKSEEAIPILIAGI